MDIFPGISIDSGVRFGKPCLDGTRIDVGTVVGALAAGESFEVVEGAYDARKSLPRFVTQHMSPPMYPRR